VLKELVGIALGEYGVKNRLFLDYVQQSGATDSFTPSLGAGLSKWKAGHVTPLAKLDAQSMGKWQAVVDDVESLSKKLGANSTILDKLGRARSREMRFVVTGQQPGALGGPLYTLYKVVSAIALAELVEKESGLPCLPLYWCGSDDTDFNEIRDLHVITRDLSAISASIAQEAHKTGMPVGDIDTAPLLDLWNRVSPFVNEQPCGKEVCDVIDRSLAAAADHGELSASILVNLLGGRIAVVDGRSHAVRRYAQSVFVSYIEDEKAIKEEVVETGKALEAAGYHSQLAIGPDSGVFIVDNGRRRSVADSERQRLVDTAASHVERCSPGVILRNLVQDYTFEPLAVVLGPAEIAYRAQIGGLYKRFGLVRPLDFPRMAATLVPPPLTDLLDLDDGPDARVLVSDPAAFATMTYRALTPPSLRESARRFDTDVKGALDRLSKGIDDGMPNKTRGKLRGRMKEVIGRVEQLSQTISEAGRSQALERWPFLTELDRLVRIGNKLQERRLSAITPFLYSSDAAAELIALSAIHVSDLMDSRARHVVYSA